MFDLDSNFNVMKEFCNSLQLWHRYIRDYIWITSNLFGSCLLNIESVVGSPGNPSTRPGWCLTCWSKPAGKQRTSAGVTPSPLPPATPPPLPACVHRAVSGRLQRLLAWKQTHPSYLFPEFSSDVAKALGAIEAHGFQASVPQHLNHLSVLWETTRGERVRGKASHTHTNKPSNRSHEAISLKHAPPFTQDQL